MNKAIKMLGALVLSAAIFTGGYSLGSDPSVVEPKTMDTTILSEPLMLETAMSMPPLQPVLLAATTAEPAPLATQEEIELIALVTMAEAEGESEHGKRLVISTILNRVDSENFPDNIHDVIYYPNAFSAMWNGRVDRCHVQEDICELVRQELVSRTDYDCVFFNANHYSIYGEPMYHVGNHYFSSYE